MIYLYTVIIFVLLASLYIYVLSIYLDLNDFLISNIADDNDYILLAIIKKEPLKKLYSLDDNDLKNTSIEVTFISLCYFIFSHKRLLNKYFKLNK